MNKEIEVSVGESRGKDKEERAKVNVKGPSKGKAGKVRGEREEKGDVKGDKIYM